MEPPDVEAQSLLDLIDYAIRRGLIENVLLVGSGIQVVFDGEVLELDGDAALPFLQAVVRAHVASGGE